MKYISYLYHIYLSNTVIGMKLRHDIAEILRKLTLSTN